MKAVVSGIDFFREFLQAFRGCEFVFYVICPIIFNGIDICRRIDPSIVLFLFDRRGSFTLREYVQFKKNNQQHTGCIQLRNFITGNIADAQLRLDLELLPLCRNHSHTYLMTKACLHRSGTSDSRNQTSEFKRPCSSVKCISRRAM